MEREKEVGNYVENNGRKWGRDSFLMLDSS
jgi:hypothetical protein